MLYVSLDDPQKNAEFAESMGAELPVVSDPDGEVAKRFGVVGFAGLYSKRWTFYIDAEGLLRAIDQEVKPETAGADIVRKLRELNFPRRATTGESVPKSEPVADGDSTSAQASPGESAD